MEGKFWRTFEGKALKLIGVAAAFWYADRYGWESTPEKAMLALLILIYMEVGDNE